MQSETRRVPLPPRSEYRFELDAGEAISVRFVSDPVSGHYGDAEVFGAPLIGGAQERWYTFGNEAKAAISSWGGGEVEIAGSASTEYMADEPSPVYTYGANLHLNLERARIRAREQLRTDKALVKSLSEQDVRGEGAPPSYEDGQGPSSNELYHAAGQGPRVMIVGPESAGKTSLVKFLANYAMRSPALASVEEGAEAERVAQEAQDDEPLSDHEDAPEEKADKAKIMSEITGWWPMIIGLDPSEGAVPVPGCLCAIPLRPSPVNCLPSPSPALPYGVTPQTTGALPPTVSTAESVMPLVHWLGKHNVRENEQHTHRVIDWLAYHVEKRLVKDTRARMSGLLLDMPGVVTADSRNRYSYIQYCARFAANPVDMIVVLGHEKLNLELSKIFGQSPVQIVKAVDVDEVYKQKLQDLQIRSYFYGMQPAIPKVAGEGEHASEALPGHAEPLGGVPTLNPYSSTIPLDLLSIYRVGQDRIAPSSALPIGAERVVSELQVNKLDPLNSSSDLSSLLHSVIALIELPSDAEELGEGELPSEATLLSAGLVGLLHVSDIDTTRKKMTVLSPKPGKLPSKTALIGVRMIKSNY